ncbi:MAG: apolipoprotein N-acyltransferase [Propionibacteriaceae bacterium]|jgi:apolipoprotein N-acyltransferase|nr:apolipoprotein N-acyltransferase [Propionibacteriaceae bacterium]
MTAQPLRPSGDDLFARWSPRRVNRVALLAAALCGAAAGLAFPPIDLWALMPLGLIGLGALLRHQPARRGLARGLAFGLAYYLVLIRWMIVIGWWPYLGLAAVMALWLGLLGAVTAVASRWPGWPCYAAACWVAVEWVASRVPLGGFPWGRLAYAGAGSPIEGLYPLVSVSGVSFLIVLSSFSLAAGLAWARRSRWAPLTASLVGLGLIGLGSWAGQSYQPCPEQGTVSVGLIQGNVPSTGLGALGPGRTTTHNSLAETIVLAARAQTGQLDQPDFVVWPESSTDMDPERDQSTGQLVEWARRLVDRPLLIGTLTMGPESGQRRTSSVWWESSDQTGDRYHKKNIVPFGEWIPARSFFLPLIPELELIGAQTVAGSGPGVVWGQTADGQPLPIGVLICFEVGYDDSADQMLRGSSDRPGGQVIVVQTNNSALTGTGQMAQQDAITRIRAMEARREIAVATTNSLAGFIGADGRLLWQAELERSAATTVQMPRRQGLTVAVAHRHSIELGLVLGPVAVWLALAGGRLVRRRSRHSAALSRRLGPVGGDRM